MTAKERVLTAVRLQEPDRVPLDIEIREELLPELFRRLDVSDEEQAYRALEIDIRRVETAPPRAFTDRGGFLHRQRKWVRSVGPQAFEDEWGIGYRADREDRYFGFVHHPLAESDDLTGYPWPDFSDPERYVLAARAMEADGGEHAIVGIAIRTLFEQAWQLRGYNQFVMDLHRNRPFVEELLDRLLELRVEQCRQYVALGVDIVHLGDDFGMQERMMVSPDLWRAFFKPRMAELISDYNRGGAIPTMYHSDGHIEPIIEDLIEIGVTVLNPVQPESMDPRALKERFGDRLAFHGTISVQTTLPQGSVEEVASTVQRRVMESGQGGGLILAPTHAIQPDTPVENVLAMYDAARKWGRYPLGPAHDNR